MRVKGFTTFGTCTHCGAELSLVSEYEPRPRSAEPFSIRDFEKALEPREPTRTYWVHAETHLMQCLAQTVAEPAAEEGE